jgi:hypothetical protein
LAAGFFHRSASPLSLNIRLFLFHYFEDFRYQQKPAKYCGVIYSDEKIGSLFYYMIGSGNSANELLADINDTGA